MSIDERTKALEPVAELRAEVQRLRDESAELRRIVFRLAGIVGDLASRTGTAVDIHKSDGDMSDAGPFDRIAWDMDEWIRAAGG